MQQQFYAHSVEGAGPEDWQKLEDHLQNVADKARAFADRFGAGEWAHLAGRLHDLGKYSFEFQQRLHGDRDRVDHATAGAQLLADRLGPAGKLLAYAVAGHHGGLPDGTGGEAGRSLQRRLHATISALAVTPEWLNNLQPLQPMASPPSPISGFRISFFLRMVYSCLVDADFLDTEWFLQQQKGEARQGWASLDQLAERFFPKLDALVAGAADTHVNRVRRQVLDDCLAAAGHAPGLFSLTVPTGGGKTLSSLAFALKHAERHGLDRIIYVIPFTSIIEQNAAVFRDYLDPEGRGDGVLEHHSSYDFGRPDQNETPPRDKLASENWDAPVIATTAVQFFESLFAARPGRCRKLHNIARSVVILDEAQMLPQPLLRPCMEAIRELFEVYGATVVLCTATQPALEKREGFPGLPKPREIMTDPQGLHKHLKRVRVEQAGVLTDEQVADRLAGEQQALCIVNTRGHARTLHEFLANRTDDAFHLSAAMCPAHRSEVIAEIKRRLSEGEPCRVVSTSLIEAGVDVDFPAVFRSMAGLDAVAQAAGRCDREGRITAQTGAPGGRLVLFEPEQTPPPGHFRTTAATTRETLRHVDADPLSPAAVERYFQMLYWQAGEKLDKKQILPLFTETAATGDFGFRTAANEFEIIEKGQIPILIPWNDEAHDLIARLPHAAHPGPILRQLQRYTVQVRRPECDELLSFGALEPMGEQVYRLRDKAFYSERLGLHAEGNESAKSEALVC